MSTFDNACCFFGHRNANLSANQQKNLYYILKNLIVTEKITVFLFGSKSQFDDLCYDIVTELKVEFQNIKRIYIRAEYPNINDEYLLYLLKSYEETYFPHSVLKSGKSAYIQRNYDMINQSSVCIIYYDKNIGLTRKSGTKIAYDYAKKKEKRIINIFEEENLQ